MEETNQEIDAFRTLAGGLVWLGSAVMPQADYFTSIMHPKIPIITFENLVQADVMLKALQRMLNVIRYRQPVENRNIDVLTFYDAAFNVSKERTYCQTGIITGVYYKDDVRTMHTLDWSITKQRRVCYSSYVAEILAF